MVIILLRSRPTKCLAWWATLSPTQRLRARRTQSHLCDWQKQAECACGDIKVWLQSVCAWAELTMKRRPDESAVDWPGNLSVRDDRKIDNVFYITLGGIGIWCCLLSSPHTFSCSSLSHLRLQTVMLSSSHVTSCRVKSLSFERLKTFFFSVSSSPWLEVDNWRAIICIL